MNVGRNVCHGSDTIEHAENEIALWFGEGINNFSAHSHKWIFEQEDEEEDDGNDDVQLSL